MCDEEKNPTVVTLQASTALAADLLRAAEKELSAFYTAILRRYGPKEARRAAHDWIDEVITMDWPVNGGLPDWRRVSIVAADCLTSRAIERLPSL